LTVGHTVNGVYFDGFCLSEGLRCGYSIEKVVVLHVEREDTRGRHRTVHTGAIRLARQGGGKSPEHPKGMPTVNPHKLGDFYVTYY
jgi:hypothetical protein